MILNHNHKEPIIKKQYMETICNGIKNQIKNLLQNQPSDQLQKNQILKHVYENSLNSQQSILNFLLTNQEHRNQCLEDLKLYLIELESQNDQKKISVLRNNVNERVEAISISVSKLNLEIQEIKQEKKNSEENALKWENMYKELQNTFEESKNLWMVKLSEEKQKYQINSSEAEKKIEEINKIKQELEEKVIKVKHEEKQKQIANNNLFIQKQKHQLEQIIQQMSQKIQIVQKIVISDEKKITKIIQRIETVHLNERINERNQQITLQAQHYTSKSNKKIDERSLDQIEQQEEEQEQSDIKDKNNEEEKEISVLQSQDLEQKNISDIPLTSRVKQTSFDIKQEEELLLEATTANELKIEIQKLKKTFQQQKLHNNSTFQASYEEYNALDDDNMCEEFISSIKNQIVQKKNEFNERIYSVILKIQAIKSILVEFQVKFQNGISEIRKKYVNSQLKSDVEIKQLNEKIDELMQKIEQYQEQRIRNSNKVEEICKKLYKINQQKQFLEKQNSKIEEQRKQITQMLETHKKQLAEKISHVMNLQDQISQLNDQKVQAKNTNDELSCCLADKDEIINKLRFQLDKTQQEYQELIRQNLSNQKVIDQLEIRIQDKNESQREMIRVIERQQEHNKKIEEKNVKISKIVTEKEEQILKLQADINCLKKTVNDLKYLTATLRKDASRVKEIQEKDWNLYNRSGSTRTQRDGELTTRQISRQMKQEREKLKSANFITKQNSQFKNSTNLNSSFKKKSSKSFICDKDPFNRTTNTPYTELVKKKYMM